MEDKTRTDIIVISISEIESCLYMESDLTFRKTSENTNVIREKSDYSGPRTPPDNIVPMKDVPLVRYETSFEKLHSNRSTLKKDLEAILRTACFVIIETDGRFLLESMSSDRTSWMDYISTGFNPKNTTSTIHKRNAELIGNVYDIVHSFCRKDESNPNYTYYDLQNYTFVVLNCIHLSKEEYDMVMQKNALISSTNRTLAYSSLVERNKVIDRLYNGMILICLSCSTRWNDGVIKFSR
eukprot:Pompholyxophrys_sp_v1_NODE_1_length_32789_cov_6.460653.p18 type:complete len:239 gc:universal NODE_1_length_32789_cov_6.460653:3366-2650(-)